MKLHFVGLVITATPIMHATPAPILYCSKHIWAMFMYKDSFVSDMTKCGFMCSKKGRRNLLSFWKVETTLSTSRNVIQIRFTFGVPVRIARNNRTNVLFSGRIFGKHSDWSPIVFFLPSYPKIEGETIYGCQHGHQSSKHMSYGGKPGCSLKIKGIRGLVFPKFCWTLMPSTSDFSFDLVMPWYSISHTGSTTYF